MPIRVMIADDQAMVRRGLRLIVESEPDMQVVAEAVDGEQAVAWARRLAPDVVLMDIRMPRMDGLEAARRILADGDGVRILVLTTFDLDEHLHAALRMGASGFLLKNASPEDLVNAVRVVARGEALLDPAVTRRVIERFATAPAARGDEPQRLDALTARENEVLVLIARGLANAEIADRLVVRLQAVRDPAQPRPAARRGPEASGRGHAERMGLDLQRGRCRLVLDDDLPARRGDGVGSCLRP